MECMEATWQKATTEARYSHGEATLFLPKHELTGACGKSKSVFRKKKRFIFLTVKTRVGVTFGLLRARLPQPKPLSIPAKPPKPSRRGLKLGV